jgi:ATP-dependent RNA helicase DDX52/ROK1
MADAIFASLASGLRFKRHDSKKSNSTDSHASHSAPSPKIHTTKSPKQKGADRSEIQKKSEAAMDVSNSDDDSEELFSISRTKAQLNDESASIQFDEEDENGSQEGSEDETKFASNFVSDRVIKVDGLDLPYEKLNKIAGERLIEVGKNHVVHTNIVSFDQLGISSWLLKNITTKLQWETPTHVQQMTIPALLAGRDLQVASPTGSGKTAAFLVPILQLLIIEHAQSTPSKDKSSKKKSTKEETDESSRVIFPQNLIVAPTIELAKQIFHQALLLCESEEARHLAVELCNKTQIQKRKENFEISPKIDLLVTTPSRLIQLIEAKFIDLSQVRHLVLDEVDRLMTDEMLGNADFILDASKGSPARRIAFFSATIMPSVEALAATVLQNPIRAKVGVKNTAADHVVQKLVYAGSEEGKLRALQRMLTAGQVRAPVLIFMQSKTRTGQLLQGLGAAPLSAERIVSGGLSSLGFKVDFITGDRTESQRREALLKFRSGETAVLITTDLLARGLDFKAVATVINYDMPTSPTTYIHRIGRTGRVGGVTGEAFTLFTDADLPHIAAIAHVMARSGQQDNVPEWVLRVAAKTKREQKGQHRKSVVQREDVGGNTASPSVSTNRPTKHTFVNPSKSYTKPTSKTDDKAKSYSKKRKAEHAPDDSRSSSAPPKKIAKGK